MGRDHARRGDHRVPGRLPDGQPPRDRHRPRRQPLGGHGGRRRRDREGHQGGRGDRVPGPHRGRPERHRGRPGQQPLVRGSGGRPDRPHHAEREHHRVHAPASRTRRGPSAIAKGPDGALWFTETAAGKIGRITTAGVITEYSAGSPGAASRRTSPTGRTATSGSPRTPTRAPSAASRPTATSPSSATGLTMNSDPLGIAAGPDGNLWFTESKAPGRIGRITTDGDITEYSTGLPAIDRPVAIAAGPDGNMWFTGNNDPGLVGRITLPPLVRDMAADTIATTSARLRGKLRAELAGHRVQLRVRAHDRLRERDAERLRGQRLRPERGHGDDRGPRARDDVPLPPGGRERRGRDQGPRPRVRDGVAPGGDVERSRSRRPESCPDFGEDRRGRARGHACS